MSLELVWGRWRRWYLRHFRSGYVKRMAEKRQGQCENCPHDIIDPRDLKYYRNVCGYWFREEDDRFARPKPERLNRYGHAEVLCLGIVFLPTVVLLALGIACVHWTFVFPVCLLTLLWFFCITFFRDPERTIPGDPDLLVSPADGTVTHVDEIEAADFPSGRAFRIGIFLSVFNVHVNRIPRKGRVISLRYFPGEFLDARNPECGVRNEQLWIDLEETETKRLVRVKQISGAIARRIVCWLKSGEEVKTGDRFGMIKFGSRTEVLIPAGEEMEVNVKVGDKVNGGSSVLLRFTSPLA